jgi:sugar lactone lactonase YvrE
MKKRLVGALILVVLATLLYLVFWPVPIEPVAWEAPAAPALTGPYEVNDALTRSWRLLEDAGIGPEDVAFDDEGRLYTGFEDGRVVRMPLPKGEPRLFAETGGRPLGMVFDPFGDLIVADAKRGLLSISPMGEVSVLATGVGDRPFSFLNDVDVGPDGTIYMSDSSTHFGYGEHRLAILEHGGDGQLLAWNPVTRAVYVLLDGLQFPNGIVVEPSGESLLFAETGAYRISRYWLRGERAGTTEVFAENLPGFPDNISRTADGRVWVPMSSPRLLLVDLLAPHPFWRKVAVRLPKWLQPKARRYGLVVELAPDGRPLRSLQDPSGAVAFVSCAMERDGVLYTGSFRDPSIVAVSLR